MSQLPALDHRRGFHLSELLLVILVVVIVLGLLFPAVQKVRGSSCLGQSWNNLKQMGLAIHNCASTYNGKFWVNNSNLNPTTGVATTAKGSFFIQILPFVEGDMIYNAIGTPGFVYPPYKLYFDPIDSSSDPTMPLLSYALNGYFVNQGSVVNANGDPLTIGATDQGGVSNGVAVLPTTFTKRGTANIIAIAGRLANKTRTYHGPDIYFYPPHISSHPAISPDFQATDATCFYTCGLLVVMMDGSVRSVPPSLGGNLSGDNSPFDIACSLDNPNPLPPAWNSTGAMNYQEARRAGRPKPSPFWDFIGVQEVRD